MIVTHHADGVRVVKQTDHAQSSAQIVRAWARPEPFDDDVWQTLCWAVEHHDDGWADESIEDPPVDFKAIHTTKHTTIWRQSIDLAAAHHPLAGVLVALYARHLYTNIDNDHVDDENMAQAFIKETADRIADQVSQIAIDPTQLQAAMNLLGFCDGLSLALLGGIGWIDRTDPLWFGKCIEPLTVRQDGERVAIDPWPFAEPRVRLTTKASMITDGQVRPHDLIWSIESDTITVSG